MLPFAAAAWACTTQGCNAGPGMQRAVISRLCCCLQGVGSHAAHLLLRSGVGRLRLVDFDQVIIVSSHDISSWLKAAPGGTHPRAIFGWTIASPLPAALTSSQGACVSK